MKPIVLIVDADNTLWDTDGVFAEAQFAMLGALEARGLQFPRQKLAFLRDVDRRMFEYHGRFEYDFSMLPSALIVAVHEGTAEIDPEIVPRDGGSDAAAAYHAFSEHLDHAIPELLPGASELIEWLREAHRTASPAVASLLVSEGDEQRLQRVARAHHLDHQVFDAVHILPGKDQAAFERAVAEGRDLLGDASALAVSVGDSLKRDIAPSKAAGCVTIYKPHGFHGQEAPSSPEQQPAHTVETIHEALGVIEDLVRNTTAAAR